MELRASVDEPRDGDPTHCTSRWRGWPRRQPDPPSDPTLLLRSDAGISTPKALHSKAQGQRRQPRHPGRRGHNTPPNPERVRNETSHCSTLSGLIPGWRRSSPQGGAPRLRRSADPGLWNAAPSGHTPHARADRIHRPMRHPARDGRPLDAIGVGASRICRYTTL